MNICDPPQLRTGGDSPQARVLLELIRQECTDAAGFFQLSRQVQGNARNRLRQMAEREQAHAACLQGLYTLLTGIHPPAVLPAVGQEEPEAMLRLCYGRKMRCLAAYQALALDSREYGPVFQRMARQEQDHCRTVLALLEEGIHAQTAAVP